MSTFKKGDIVICKTYEISQKLVCSTYGAKIENYIHDCYFNREAVIEHTYKEYMEDYFKNDLHEEHEDKDEYVIRFLDNGTTIAWVSANELVSKVPMDNLLNIICFNNNSLLKDYLGKTEYE